MAGSVKTPPTATSTRRAKLSLAADADSLYSDSEPALQPCFAAAIPCYLWGNRGETQMRVWMGRV